MPGTFARLALLLLSLCAAQPALANARWITHPQAAPGKPVTLQFRREMTLVAVPKRMDVEVSADNRFILYVNGVRVADGPARGDLAHWRYRPLDLAPFLRRGRNVIAAQVWNDAVFAPAAQISARTGFHLAGPPDLETGPAWQVRLDPSRTVASGAAQTAKLVKPELYYAAAPPETVDAAKRSADWSAPRTTATDWQPAVDALAPGEASPWTLVSDTLPAMAYREAPAGRVVRAEGIAAARFPDAAITVPANRTVTLLIDAGQVQAAYPDLLVSGGRGSEVTLTYAEALYGADKTYLHDRASIAGGTALGLTDTFRPDGMANSRFQPAWWRVWRFLELRVTTGAAPLTLDRLTRHATGYPFEQRARFVSSDAALNRIWSIGWDTVRLDAHETFMDTAYWEQLQYVGDTRIEALVSYAVGGDPRLGAQAIAAIDASREAYRNGGLPQSRWPSKEAQSIPPFSLLWVGMVHDAWQRWPDTTPVRASLPGIRAVLDWYRPYIGADGLVGTTPGWEFIDWRPTLGNTPWGKTKPVSDSCIVTLLAIGAWQQAADLEQAVGDAARAATDRSEASRLAQALQRRCWSATRGLYADAPDQQAFSQHANVLAILYDVAPKAAQQGILDRVTVRGGGIAAPQGVTPTTYYFAFYLARALDHAGLGDRYVEMLATWRAMLAQNFTTWPEEPDPTRSDSHAWSAHPTLDLLGIVAGIRPAAPGFARVEIAPHLGDLTRLDAAMAHPAGLIETDYRRAGDTLRVRVTLPAAIPGEFSLGGRRIPLHPGRNAFTLPMPRTKD